MMHLNANAKDATRHWSTIPYHGKDENWSACDRDRLSFFQRERRFDPHAITGYIANSDCDWTAIALQQFGWNRNRKTGRPSQAGALDVINGYVHLVLVFLGPAVQGLPFERE